MSILKCGKITYTLIGGETILDNGNCFQLVNSNNNKLAGREVPPKVSTKEFLKFIRNPRVTKKVVTRSYEVVTLWTYTINKKEEGK